MIKIFVGFVAGVFYGVIVSVELPKLPLTIMEMMFKMMFSSEG